MTRISYLHPPTVWLLTDNKPGHRSQLQGLGARLEAVANARLVWIDATRHLVPLWRALFALPLPLGYPSPDIIVAAGSGTHRLLLSLRRRRALTAVLMRPAFPLSWVDAAIIPAHDKPPEEPGVLITRGALNPIQPRQHSPTEQRGLILLGGPSRHYVWDDEVVYQQIAVLSEQFPDWQWLLTSSRRTPDSFLHRIAAASFPNVTFYHHDDTDPDWVAQALSQSRVAWVTPDSVSMVYEALTAGLPTGLLNLEAVPQSRVARGLMELEHTGRVAPWSDRMALMKVDGEDVEPLWEADRAAHWLLQRWQERP